MMKRIVWKMMRIFLLLSVVLQACAFKDGAKIQPRLRFEDALEIENFTKTFYSARPFPVCLKQSALPTSGISQEAFEHLNDSIAQLYETNLILQTMTNFTDHIRLPYKSMKLDRITVPVLGAYNLRQWMHISIDFTPLIPSTNVKSKLDFLLMQSVASPLGLPFGEFRTMNDTECSDDDKHILENTPNETYIIPCTYRPRSAIRHPHVFVGHDFDGFTDLHFNFNWINSICQSVIAMQFLLLFHIKGERNYRTALTPAILLEKKDSLDGVPYPFYRGWTRSEVRCHGLNPNLLDPSEKPERVPARIDPCVFRVIHNPEFDKCILDDIGLSPDGKSCPPGPFYCEKDLKAASKKNYAIQDPPGTVRATKIDDYIAALSKSWAYCPFFDNGEVEECNTINRVKILKICFQEDHKTTDQIIEIQNLNKIDGNEHGLYMLIMLLCHTLSIYYARFFKEAGKKGSLGIGFWLLSHFLFTFLTTLFMWLGVSKYTGRRFGVHGVIGYLAVLMFHVNLIIGFIRPMKQQKRSTFIISHMVLGYISHLLMIVAGCITSSCSAILVYIFGSQIIILVCCLSITYSPIMIGGDSKLNRVRKMFPVPEALEPETCTKLMISFAAIPFPLFTVFMIGSVFNYRSYATSVEEQPSLECEF